MSANKKVMFVDDEEAVRMSFNRYLSEDGFEVTTVEDGEKAINRLRRQAVDVVVADLKMPNVDGIQLLQWMHDQQPDTPFILLTGYGNEEVERKVRELGAYEYLNKPISPDALSAVLTAATVLNILPETTGVAEPEPEVEPEPVAAEAEPETRSGFARIGRVFEVVGGLIMAPLAGLAFVIFLPVIGFGTAFWVLGEKIWRIFRPASV